MSSIGHRFIGTGVMVSLLAGLAQAQYASDKVVLKSRIDLNTFGAVSGNDCWGYVSPSGREYALMGCSNKLAFVEITNPAAPDHFASIAHPPSTWGDIKVYGRYAYLVTETSGTGIQVIDMGNIDNHVVNLVRTIPAPDRSHNVAVDEVSGFLYTLGSNGGEGTTTCWDLSDPSNPVRVGAASLTSHYIHDAQIVTYTSGPYTGRQILFGSSTSRGVDVYDVTDKNNPVHLSQGVYPNIGYCHQAWLSEDRRFLYVNDEMDETGSGYTTRTLVFDVTNLSSISLVSSFTSGESAIDHNLYVKNGFVFEANYRSGLRIFDANDSQTAPVQVGYFDTYPADNHTGYDGAWSTFPYFPSGTVIVSDINRGLFVLDPSEALSRYQAPTSFIVLRGLLASGGIADLAASDDSYLVLRRNLAVDQTGAHIQVRLDGVSPTETPVSLGFVLESKAQIGGVHQVVELFDWTANQFVVVDSRTATLSDSTLTAAASGNLARFVQPGTRALRARIGWTNDQSDTTEAWTASIDRAVWKISS